MKLEKLKKLKKLSLPSVVRSYSQQPFWVEYLSVKHMALTSLTSLNSLTSPFAKVELMINVNILSCISVCKFIKRVGCFPL